MPQLIARMYHHSESAPTVAPEVPAAVHRHPLRAAAYTALGTSAALLVSGIGVGVASRKAHDRYTATPVTDAESADRANAELDHAQQRARAANVLFVSSAAAATTGLVMLLWARFKRGERPPQVALGVEPVPSGGFVQVTGRLGRM